MESKNHEKAKKINIEPFNAAKMIFYKRSLKQKKLRPSIVIEKVGGETRRDIKKYLEPIKKQNPKKDPLDYIYSDNNKDNDEGYSELDKGDDQYVEKDDFDPWKTLSSLSSKIDKIYKEIDSLRNETGTLRLKIESVELEDDDDDDDNDDNVDEIYYYNSDGSDNDSNSDDSNSDSDEWDSFFDTKSN